MDENMLVESRQALYLEPENVKFRAHGKWWAKDRIFSRGGFPASTGIL